MKATRTVLTISLAALMALAACQKKGGDTGPGGSASLSLFPKDSNMYMSVDLDNMRKSSMWGDISTKLKDGFGDEFKDIMTACDMDPFKELKAVTAAGNVETQQGAMVARGLARKALADCTKKAAEKDGKKVDWKDEGNITILTTDDKTMHLGWVNDTTVLLPMDDKADKAWVTARLEGKDGLDKNKEFTDNIKLAKPSAVWGVVVPPAAGAGMFAMLGGAPKLIYFSVDLANGVNLDLGMRYDNADKAKAASTAMTNMTGMMGAQPQMAPVMKGLKIEAKDADVKVDLVLSKDDVTKLTQGMGGALPL